MARSHCKRCGFPFDKTNTIRRRYTYKGRSRKTRACRNCHRQQHARLREREKMIRAAMHGLAGHGRGVNA